MRRMGAIGLLVCYAVTVLGGTLLHFLFDLTGGAVWTAPFSGVNESTWEHMKLLFWPMLLIAVVQRLFMGVGESFWCIKRNAVLIGLGLIPVLFYTWNGVIGKSPDWVNITIFFVSAAAAYFYEGMAYKRGGVPCMSDRWAILTLCAIGVMFVWFTFSPPTLGIFRDPVSGGYGIP